MLHSFKHMYSLPLVHHPKAVLLANPTALHRLSTATGRGGDLRGICTPVIECTLAFLRGADHSLLKIVLRSETGSLQLRGDAGHILLYIVLVANAIGTSQYRSAGYYYCTVGASEKHQKREMSPTVLSRHLTEGGENVSRQPTTGILRHRTNAARLGTLSVRYQMLRSW